MKNRSQIVPSCFSGPTKLVNLELSPPVAWLGILQVNDSDFRLSQGRKLSYYSDYYSKYPKY